MAEDQKAEVRIALSEPMAAAIRVQTIRNNENRREAMAALTRLQEGERNTQEIVNALALQYGYPVEDFHFYTVEEDAEKKHWLRPQPKPAA